MPRFYIDTDDGYLLVNDEAGEHYADVQAACAVARATLPDMAKDRLKDCARSEFSARVRDESGTTVYVASLRVDAEWLVAPPPA